MITSNASHSSSTSFFLNSRVCLAGLCRTVQTMGWGQRKPGRYGHSLLMAFPLTIARASLLRDSWKIRLQSPTKSSTSIYSIVLSSVFHSLSILRISRTIFVQHSPVHEWVGHHKNNSNISHLTGPTFNPLTSEL